MARTLNFVVRPEEDGRPAYRVLHGRGVSRRLLNSLKRLPGGMARNGSSIMRTVDPVQSGDVLVLHLPEDEAVPEPLPFPLEVLYEDEDILVVSKPPTLAMHPTRKHQGNTLANAVSAHLMSRGLRATFRAAGRLDRGTSGIVVCALHSYALTRLTGHIEKTYLALAHGTLEGEGTFRNTIYRPRPNCTLRACREENAPLQPGDETAITHWRALGQKDGVTFLQITLETGRTHQIRTHFAHHGMPLLGDDYYGAPPRPEGRHFLHCWRVRLRHPVTEEMMCFTAPLPEEMRKLIA
ncbi:MAG: RluA family pseudouridine synthase [Oscillospiraceae bacterium]|nr:RluA family pseudouridine synthase [Oscillospiraceae bacterium]